MMTPETFNRLHSLRAENDEVKHAQDKIRPRFDRLAGRHENGTAPRALSAYQLFQTPVEIASKMAAALNIETGDRILEPSAGLGRLIDALRWYDPREIVAVEINGGLSNELAGLNPGMQILTRDFLTVDPDQDGLGLFDAVIMNPPFHLRSDFQHIEHAMTFLKHNGRLAALCMNTERRQQAFRSVAREWIELPEGSFREAGTNINAAIVIMEKARS